MIANRTQLADIFGVALSTVDAWRKRGCPVIESGQKGKANKYDTVAVIAWHNGNSEDFDLQAERAKLAIEQTRKTKRENDLAEKEIAPVSLLTDAILKVATQMIPILESLPLVMKRNWPEITGDQIQLVKKSTAECRNLIAGMEIDFD